MSSSPSWYMQTEHHRKVLLLLIYWCDTTSILSAM